MGLNGGFILGSGCETLINAKPENAHAWGDSVEKHSKY